jgi:hypothetical protein
MTVQFTKPVAFGDFVQYQIGDIDTFVPGIERSLINGGVAVSSTTVLIGARCPVTAEVNPTSGRVDVMSQPIGLLDGKVLPLGYACVAYNSGASIDVLATYAVAAFTANPVTDPAFSLATGIITFPCDCLFHSTVMVNPGASVSGLTYFTNAEISLNGGDTWVAGDYSTRAEGLAANFLRTREFSFSGRFLEGTLLRFIERGSDTGITLTTVADGTKHIPARRLTYDRVPVLLGT